MPEMCRSGEAGEAAVWAVAGGYWKWLCLPDSLADCLPAADAWPFGWSGSAVAQPDVGVGDSGTGVFAVSYFIVLLLVSGSLLIVLQLSRLADRPVRDIATSSGQPARPTAPRHTA